MIDLKYGDCLDVMKKIPDNSIDLIVSDCPYKIVQGGCSNRTVTFKPMSGVLDKRKSNYQKDLTNSIENVKAGKIFKHNDIDVEEGKS